MSKNSKNSEPDADAGAIASAVATNGDQDAMLVAHLLADASDNHGLDRSAPDLPHRVVVVREVAWDTTADDLYKAFSHIGVIQAATVDQERHAGLVVFCCHAAAVQAIRQPAERWSEFGFDCCELAPASMVLSTSRLATSTTNGAVCQHLLNSTVASVLALVTPEFLAERWTGIGHGPDESAPAMEGGARSFLEDLEKIGSAVATVCDKKTTEMIRVLLSTSTSDGAAPQHLLDAAVASVLAPEMLTFLTERWTGISQGPDEPVPAMEDGARSVLEEPEKIGSAARSSPARNAQSTEMMAHQGLNAAVASAVASGMLKTLDERWKGFGHDLNDCTSAMHGTRSILGEATKLSSEKVESPNADLLTTEGTTSATAESTSVASTLGGVPLLPTPDQLALPPLYGAMVQDRLNQSNRMTLWKHPGFLIHWRLPQGMAPHGAYLSGITWRQPADLFTPMMPAMAAHPWSGMQRNLGYFIAPRGEMQQVIPRAQPNFVRRIGDLEFVSGGRFPVPEQGGGMDGGEPRQVVEKTASGLGRGNVR